ncbi:MAG TPA: nitroreductase family deazaflavin-dependent oxidoreductase [Actinomycetota bacterium]|nr:nitroreductase family deazaflavin-dependent oxidoreductase [Actinomycetota bacterium]
MVNDWNTNIIEEFRSNEGRVGGPFENAPILLMHHTGAKSGVERVNPLAYQPIDENTWAVFGSKGGAPTHPDWYYNVKAHPKGRAEIGTDMIDVTFRVAEGDERERIWEKQKHLMPPFAQYERKTDRQIPVVILERAG